MSEIISDEKSNLQSLLANQEGIHKASAHLRVQGLLQLTEESKVLLPICLFEFYEFRHPSQPFKEAWKHVIKLQKKKKKVS